MSLYNGNVNCDEHDINRMEIEIFSTFEEADRSDREYWHSKTPLERLEALELLRQTAYGYDDPTTSRLQRVLEVVRGE